MFVGAVVVVVVVWQPHDKKATEIMDTRMIKRIRTSMST
jgi:hypothetical protein